MADIAVVFHWPLSDMITLDIDELMDWRERARIRTEAEG